MSSGKERKFLSSKPSLPSPHYTLEDAWKQYGNEFNSPEEFIEHVATEIKLCNDDIQHFAQNYFYVISVDRGREVIQLYNCQKTIIQNLVDNRFNAIVASRQIGKTTIVTIYALWQACFNKDQNIFVLANKEDTAKMILDRIRLAYEEIPNWLKPAVVEFSKTSIKFDNGSKISTSTTSEQGIRGQAANCVDGSSIVTIRDKNTKRVFDISMEELYTILENGGEIIPIFIDPE